MTRAAAVASLLLPLALTGACMVDPVEVDGAVGADGKADGLTAGPRLGARPVPGGVAFAVWAPNADRVFVTGSFNGWSDTRNELVRGPGGVFAAVVFGVLNMPPKIGRAVGAVEPGSTGLVGTLGSPLTI